MTAPSPSSGRPIPQPQRGKLGTCPLCGAGDHQLLYPATIHPGEPLSAGEFTCTNIHFGRHLNIFKCPGCGLIYSEEEQSQGEILGSYEDVVDETYLQETQGRIMTFRRHLRDMTPFLPGRVLTNTLRAPGRRAPGNRRFPRFFGNLFPGKSVEKVQDGLSQDSVSMNRRHLDVGAYVGVFMNVAREAGWDTHGVEPSRWAREQNPALQGRYLGATLDDLLPAQAASFDILTMWDVIEHLTDPFHTVRQCALLLKPGGLFALSTHNMQSQWARLYGSRYPFLMRMHLFHFSNQTIVRLLEDSGFEVVKLYKHRRFLSVDYFLNRLESLFPPLAKILRVPARLLGLERRYVPMFSFGLMNVLAVKR